MSTENEYTPLIEDVEEAYRMARRGARPKDTTPFDEEFSRWLAAHDAEVAAKALEDAAAQINREFQALPSWMESHKAGERTQDWMSGGTRMVMDTIDWLNARAAALRASTGGESK